MSTCSQQHSRRTAVVMVSRQTANPSSSSRSSIVSSPSSYTLCGRLQRQLLQGPTNSRGVMRRRQSLALQLSAARHREAPIRATLPILCGAPCLLDCNAISRKHSLAHRSSHFQVRWSLLPPPPPRQPGHPVGQDPHSAQSGRSIIIRASCTAC